MLHFLARVPIFLVLLSPLKCSKTVLFSKTTHAAMVKLYGELPHSEMINIIHTCLNNATMWTVIMFIIHFKCLSFGYCLMNSEENNYFNLFFLSALPLGLLCGSIFSTLERNIFNLFWVAVRSCTMVTFWPTWGLSGTVDQNLAVCLR